jgi:chromosome segregation ATPase
MPLSESQRNQIASYRVQIERLRQDLQRLKDQKKDKSAYYSNLIKATKDAYSKRSHRQSKITAINGLVNQIESKKRDIERVKGYIASIRR